MSTTYYYPFGMMMPGTVYSQEEYRYGFNGMEKDDEMQGQGNSYDFGARMYDPRVARWNSCDNLERLFIPFSPYNFAINNPINIVDVDGNVISGDVEQFLTDVRAIFEKVGNADVFLQLLASVEDGHLSKISESDFLKAYSALDDDPYAQALAKGLFEAINSDIIYDIHYIDDNTNVARLVQEDVEIRDRLLGVTGRYFRPENGLPSGRFSTFHGATTFKVASLEERTFKHYVIVHRDAVSESMTFGGIGFGEGDKTVSGNPSTVTMNLLFNAFFESDDYVEDWGKTRTLHTSPNNAGYMMENIARFERELPFVSSGGPILRSTPKELRKPKERKRRGSKKQNRHANPRFL